MMPPAGMPRPDSGGARRASPRISNQPSTRRRSRPRCCARPAMHRLNRAGVRQRDPRSLRVDARRRLDAAARRRGVRLRQQRHGAEHLAVADGALPVGRLEDQQPRRGEPEDHAERSKRSASAAICRSTTTWQGLPIGTRGGISIRHYFPVDGEYVISPRLYRETVNIIRGLELPHDLEVALDGERVRAGAFRRPEGRAGELPPADAGRRRDGEALPDADDGQGGTRTRSASRSSRRARRRRWSCCSRSSASASTRSRRSASPSWISVTIEGPFKPAATSASSPSRRKIFVCAARRGGAGRRRMRHDDPHHAGPPRVPRRR